MGTNKEFPIEKRCLIITLHILSESNRKISRRLQIARRTVETLASTLKSNELY